MHVGEEHRLPPDRQIATPSTSAMATFVVHTLVIWREPVAVLLPAQALPDREVERAAEQQRGGMPHDAVAERRSAATARGIRAR